jgi:hypothetical protein
MQALEKIEQEVKRLTRAEPEARRDWLENLLEDRMQLKEGFKADIEAGKKVLQKAVIAFAGRKSQGNWRLPRMSYAATATRGVNWRDEDTGLDFARDGAHAAQTNWRNSVVRPKRPCVPSPWPQVGCLRRNTLRGWRQVRARRDGLLSKFGVKSGL